MARKRPPISFPELEHRGRGAILRSAEEVQAEQALLEAEQTNPPDGRARVAEPSVNKSTSPQVDQTTNPQTGKSAKPLVEKYTTHLRPATIKAIKRVAFESERKDYEIVQEALDAYLNRVE